MATEGKRTVLVHDTPVTVRRPWLAGTACLLTAGIAGAVHHHRMTRDLARFGRARGAMPFAFIPVTPGASTLAWVAGLLGWFGFVALVAAIAVQAARGAYDASSEDITTFASLLVLLAPAWIVAARTSRRITTARHLVGVPGSSPSPIVAAVIAALLPPLGSWHAQRQLNRAWEQWRA
ncbi:MAG: hypothetical protein JWM98_666 [Thermoleophilia bacterium]|nr:hypothetical protein [Thermoleophilia bacterium]